MLIRHNRLSLVSFHTLRPGNVFKRQSNGPEFMVVEHTLDELFNAVDLHTGQVVYFSATINVYHLPQAVLDTGDIVE